MHTDYVSATNASPAHQWFLNNLPEIESRALASLSRLKPDMREEAVAEVLAAVFKAAVHAEARKTLDRITPFHAVVFAIRQYREGRRMAGYSSRDVLSEAAHLLNRSQVTSLESPVPTPDRGRRSRNQQTLADVLADRRSDSDPVERARMNLDYPSILIKEQVSRRARRLFQLLSQVRGRGCGKRIAQMMQVSPARVCQMKQTLASALAKHGYAPC